MKVTILNECGYEEALLGLSLSYNQPVEKMPKVAAKLYNKGDEESKFLRQIAVWIDITAPRYWWQQMREYKVGCEYQSESTMHTIMRQPLARDDFAGGINDVILAELNHQILHCSKTYDAFQRVKAWLPEGFLQRRIVCTNYQTLRRIIRQRKSHRLPEWQTFILAILGQIEHEEFFGDCSIQAHQ